MKELLLKATITLLGLCMTFSVAAEPSENQGMPNVEVQSTYEWAGTLVTRYVDGIVEYSFISGKRKGAGGMNLSFTSRKIGEQLYLLSWHDESSSNYITQVLDFANMKEHHTAIMFYGTDMQQTNWTEGVIDKVSWLE